MAKKNYAYGGKAAAILEWLNTEPTASDHHIAKHVQCSTGYVHKMRKLMAHVPETSKPETVANTNKERFQELIDDWGKVDEDDAPASVDAILDERGSRYGNFYDHARVTFELKAVARSFANEKDKVFDYDQMEAIDMIFHKIGRILNGDPNYADSWVDIAGYAKLVADRLQGTTR